MSDPKANRTKRHVRALMSVMIDTGQMLKRGDTAQLGLQEATDRAARGQVQIVDAPVAKPAAKSDAKSDQPDIA